MVLGASKGFKLALKGCGRLSRLSVQGGLFLYIGLSAPSSIILCYMVLFCDIFKGLAGNRIILGRGSG